MNILFLHSSILGPQSVTRTLSAALLERLQSTYPDASIAHRNLAEDPIPHISSQYLQALTDPAAPRSSAIEAEIAQSAAVMAEFKAADIIVVGAPMYNFGVPSTLKAWIDRIAVAGETFRYFASGPEGLCKGKQVFILSGRGSALSGTPWEVMDHQEKHLETLFGFLGIDDITIVRAEGVAASPDARGAALDAAQQQIAAIHFVLPASVGEPALI